MSLSRHPVVRRCTITGQGAPLPPGVRGEALRLELYGEMLSSLALSQVREPLHSMSLHCYYTLDLLNRDLSRLYKFTDDDLVLRRVLVLTKRKLRFMTLHFPRYLMRYTSCPFSSSTSPTVCSAIWARPPSSSTC